MLEIELTGLTEDSLGRSSMVPTTGLLAEAMVADIVTARGERGREEKW